MSLALAIIAALLALALGGAGVVFMLICWLAGKLDDL